MTADQILQCKNTLLQLHKEHQALERKCEESADTVMPDQSSASRLSLVDAMQKQQVILQASRRREMHAEAIEGGLRRIEAGQFGHCFYCEEAIPFSSLEADPTNTRCVKCAKMDSF